MSDLRDQLGWMSPKTTADYLTLVTAQKLIYHRQPEALSALFTHNSDARERSTRQDHHFHLPRSRLETGKRRFSYRAVALLNSLPTDAIEQRPTGFARTAKVVLLNGQSK